MWGWLQELSGGAATFIGSLTGAAIGLIALLIGALFNAHLNRRRDDRLRNEERGGIVSAIRAELSRLRVSLMRNAEELDHPKEDFIIPDIAHSARVMPHVLPRIWLLDSETISEVMDVYVSIDQYCEALVMMGGNMLAQNRPDRRVIGLPAARAKSVAKMNRDLCGMIDVAIKRLDEQKSGCR
jgi:hypothetical protein